MFTVSVNAIALAVHSSSPTFYHHHAEGHSFSLDRVTCGGLAGFERHMLRGFNIDIPPRDKRSVVGRRLRREKCREGGNDNKISARFREFQRRTSRKGRKKKGFDPFLGKDSFGDKTSRSMIAILQYTQQIERQFPLEN